MVLEQPRCITRSLLDLLTLRFSPPADGIRISILTSPPSDWWTPEKLRSMTPSSLWLILPLSRRKDTWKAVAIESPSVSGAQARHACTIHPTPLIGWASLLFRYHILQVRSSFYSFSFLVRVSLNHKKVLKSRHWSHKIQMVLLPGTHSSTLCPPRLIIQQPLFCPREPPEKPPTTSQCHTALQQSTWDRWHL